MIFDFGEGLARHGEERGEVLKKPLMIANPTIFLIESLTLEENKSLLGTIFNHKMTNSIFFTSSGS